MVIEGYFCEKKCAPKDFAEFFIELTIFLENPLHLLATQTLFDSHYIECALLFLKFRIPRKTYFFLSKIALLALKCHLATFSGQISEICDF